MGSNFADGQSSKFSWFKDACDHAHCTLHNRIYFASLTFADSRPSAKTAKIKPHENFPLYGTSSSCISIYHGMWGIMDISPYWLGNLKKELIGTNTFPGKLCHNIIMMRSVESMVHTLSFRYLRWSSLNRVTKYLHRLMYNYCNTICLLINL